MIIKTLPELSKLLLYYKNPYILCHYKGIDWAQYIKYDIYSYKSLKICENLFLVSCMKNHIYKIRDKDFVTVLEGELLIDEKRLEENSHILYYYKKYEKYGICKGYKDYNCFFHYTHT